MLTTTFKIGIVAIAGLAIAACETRPQTSNAIEDARAAVQAASSDPNVAKFAPTELARARNLLTNAEGDAKDKGAKDPNTANYAYLAMQMAHIAEQHAREQVAIQRVKAGEAERQKILLAARENEANSALSQARQAQVAAEQARNEAQNAQSEMAAAQAEAQRLANELQNVKSSQTSRGLVLTLNTCCSTPAARSSSPARAVRSTRSRSSSTSIPIGVSRSKASPTARAPTATTRSCPRSAPTPSRPPSRSGASTRSACARSATVRSSR